MTKPIRVRIAGTGSYVPDKVLSNADLERMVDTSDEWIMTRTGIKERHLAAPDQSTSDLAVVASRRALESAKLAPLDLDLIIVATITPDMQFPSTSCLLQEKIGAKNAFCFDIGAACSGFIYGVEVANMFLKSGAYKNALIVGAEKLSSIVDWTDRSTCILFGDGAGAAVLVADKSESGIVTTYLASDGSSANLLMLPAGGSKIPATVDTIANRLHFLKMEGREVFKCAVTAMEQATGEVLKRAGLKTADITWLITHQANMRIISALAKRLELPDEKVYKNVDRYGNMSSASTAVGLDEVIRSGKLKKGDIILMVVFGSGLTWGSCVIKW
ncbi:MAG TPA: beta-ketoacyl-ACP synthase III [bacterium]|nr:beta-ketoacyl-ACP synthase III [bacterium]